jgi:hypothetical protein
MQADYLPHQFCLAGDNKLVWTNALADSVIGLSYLFISGILAWFTRQARRKLPGIRGTDLTRQVSELHPGIRVIYMSGYAPGFLDESIPAVASFL